ncbi:hypothetical protein BDZ89DRAFT_591257 [Hymenopellis radicata]|nr:hypothetical protein BDZ89DRAFT_591257 [Hymenopellis radicata]
METHLDESTPLAAGSTTHSNLTRQRVFPRLALKLQLPFAPQARPRSKSIRQPKSPKKSKSVFFAPIRRIAPAPVVLAPSPKRKGKLNTIHPRTPVCFDFPPEDSDVTSEDSDNLSVASAPIPSCENPFATPPRSAARLALASLNGGVDDDGDFIMDVDSSPTGSMKRRRSQKKVLQLLGDEAVGDVAKM